MNTRNAFGQIVRPATAADKRRAASHAPFSGPIGTRGSVYSKPVVRPAVAVWVGK